MASVHLNVVYAAVILGIHLSLSVTLMHCVNPFKAQWHQMVTSRNSMPSRSKLHF